MDTEKENSYFRELTFNLQREGLTAKAETEEGLLPVELDGQRLCFALPGGGVRYWKEDAADDHRSAALNRAAGIAKITAEYMGQLETAPPLTASGLTGDYRLLADFNDTVLAGHPTRYGVQFVTWERARDRAGLNAGNYFGPGGGSDSYTAAKRDFAVRSGLIPRGALFTPEQLMEIYRCCTEVSAGLYPVTEKQQKCLESIIEQVERGLPDLEERLRKEQAPEALEAPEGGGMKFC